MKAALETLVRDGFILVFNSNELDVVKTAEALQKAGMNNMEVTCRIENCLEKIAGLKVSKPEFVAGAASLIDFDGLREVYNKNHQDQPIPSVDEAVEAGSDYLVSAINFSEKSYDKYAKMIPMVPGCGTATEIISQFALGASFCKLFPAAVIGGVKYIKSIDPAVHKTVSIMPTGGTNMGNIPDYIDAGVLILGGSFSMFGEAFKTIVAEQDYDLLASELKKVKDLIDTERAKKYPGLDFRTASIEEIQKVTGRNFNI